MAITLKSSRAPILAIAMCVFTADLAAQTAIKLPKNKYTPKQDVQLGQEAAAEVRKQYPVIQDEQINKYLSGLGDRLVAAAPAELNESVYQYSFTPVNLKEINAFALPGGPMFVNRGMFTAAAAEGEVVGVMAHELAHVLLRHGTANATKAQNPWLQIGQLAGQLGGAMVGGGVGSAIAQGSEFGLGTLLLRYSRDFEKQADLLGAQMVAKAGYDPRSLARMFETIARESKAGGGNPQWMSSHPDPGNRSAYIVKEAEALTIATAADSSRFQPIKATFAALPPPKSMRDPANANASNSESAAAPNTGTPGQPVARPSGQFKDISGGKVFQASVPADWVAMPSKSSIKIVPQNGYGPLNGQTVWSHGIEFGIIKASSRDLQEATNAWLGAVAQSNPELKPAGPQQPMKISQRSALATSLVNPSPLGGAERVSLYTTFLADGTLFYYLTVVPDADAQAFQETFRKVGESIRLTEVR
jgi:Zn-dependent protease with chaperone function